MKFASEQMPAGTAAAPGPDCLQVRDLTAGYGGPPVISGISLGIEKGQVAVVAGPNGAGKSTLVKSIVGHLPCVSGSVTAGGVDITNHPAEKIARGGVGYVPQNDDVFTTLTVLENLEIGGYLLRKREVARRIDEVLEVFPDLARMRTRPVSRLSGGERKMVAIGRVLMLRPAVLILDEPTAGLAVQLTTELFERYIPALAGNGAGVLLVEQKATEALQAADWGYILVSGQVHVSEPASTILSRPDLGEVFLGGSTSLADHGSDGDADDDEEPPP
ncbi:MAG: ABC transporter ATP-binding protein [Nocardiopsaceae bacterium]|nr:ABC transporter ATP-binding protein [Nocardiopsaceae bacterium]